MSNDYLRGLMDADFAHDVARIGRGNTIAELQARLNKLADQSWEWKAKCDNLAAQLAETRRALAETQEVLEEERMSHRSEKTGLIARSNTILEEATLCRENPNITPVFSAPGPEGRSERERIKLRYIELQKQADNGDEGAKKIIETSGGLTAEDLLRYHRARSEGISKPEI